ncbi:MAG TPA: helix-turn-helix domain-containing protein [Arachidicoccus sp.]
MESKYVQLKSISDLHDLYDDAKPKHPLVSCIDLTKVNRSNLLDGTLYSLGFYSVFYKKVRGSLRYGRASYDFDEGSLMFTAPNQVISSSSELQIEEGWGLCFHPDLLIRSELGRKINNYSFFHYDSNEALHISEDERLIITDCLEKIKREYSQNIDKHTQGLVVNNIELLLNYCNRFYDRQFITRLKVNNDIVQRFELLLQEYFLQETLVEIGLPDVKYFASRLNLSPNYLSDLLNKYTGKATQEHIHLQLVEKAKSLLWNADKSISEIAYELGFEHPSHFTKIFKTKTGKSPKEFRTLN